MLRKIVVRVGVGLIVLILAVAAMTAPGQAADDKKAAPSGNPPPVVSTTAPKSLATAEEMASLDVLAGQWAGEVNKIELHVTAKWDANKKFLRREISMSQGKASLNATQEIGWDPVAKEIRSWMFSDDGSFTEGVWSLEGNAWMVLSSRVLPDGKITKATQVYKFPDKDTLVWKQIRGSIDDQPTADFEVVLKRVPTK